MKNVTFRVVIEAVSTANAVTVRTRRIAGHMPDLITRAVTEAQNHVVVVIEFDVRQPRLIAPHREIVSRRFVKLRQFVPIVGPRLPSSAQRSRIEIERR